MPTIICPNCNQTYEVDENVIGGKVKCAVCNITFVTQAPNDLQKANDIASQEQRNYNPTNCPFCNYTLVPGAPFCPNCGNRVNAINDNAMNSYSGNAPQKKNNTLRNFINNDVHVQKSLAPSRKNKRTLIAIATVVVAIVVVLIIALGGKSGSTSIESQSTASKQKLKLPKRIQEDIAQGFKFSEDGKTLWNAPRTITKYDIPNGVTSIGYGAFFWAQVSGKYNYSK